LAGDVALLHTELQEAAVGLAIARVGINPIESNLFRRGQAQRRQANEEIGSTETRSFRDRQLIDPRTPTRGTNQRNIEQALSGLR